MKNTVAGVSLEDFEILKVLGQGSHGRVSLVKKIGGNDDGMLYALKSINVDFRGQECDISRIKLEREILVATSHPLVLKMFYAFQTEGRVHLVLQFLQGGDLFDRIDAAFCHGKGFSEDQVRFYIAEVIIAVDHIHQLGIIHRDIKPENILIGKDGHLILADFGLCAYNGKSNSTSGTTDYMAPEVVIGSIQTTAVDWWSVGVLMYQMLTRKYAFGTPADSIKKNILSLNPSIPDWLSLSATSLLTGLLNKNPNLRLGSGSDGVSEIVRHPFFSSVDWGKLLTREAEPPFVPDQMAPDDLKYFDTEFTSMDPQE